jgi:hypothetical protein
MISAVLQSFCTDLAYAANAPHVPGAYRRTELPRREQPQWAHPLCRAAVP